MLYAVLPKSVHYYWNACWLSIFGRKKVYMRVLVWNSADARPLRTAYVTKIQTSYNATTTSFLVCVWPVFNNYSAAHSAVRHWAKQFDKLYQRLAIVQNRLDASLLMVVVNWTLCITFGTFKLFGQWAVYFVTLVRVWKASWRTVWNECRIVLKICHSLRTMLKISSRTNWNPISAISYAHLPISLHQLWELCRVLLLRSNSFDDWPSSNAKRCGTSPNSRMLGQNAR